MWSGHLLHMVQDGTTDLIGAVNATTGVAVAVKEQI